MIGDGVFQQYIEVDGDFAGVGRDIDFDGVDVVRVTRPRQSHFSGMDPDRGQVLDGTSRSVFAGNPSGVGEGEGPRLHADFLMHKSDSPEGLGLIDLQRHNGDWGALCDHVSFGDGEEKQET
jgi:hypothetical protein